MTLNPHYTSTTIQSNDSTFFINTNREWQNNASEAKQKKKSKLACHSCEELCEWYDILFLEYNQIIPIQQSMTLI